jgi:hypothetical protein
LSSNTRQLPTYINNGTFAQFVLAALANFAAQAANCRTSLPPGVIVDAAVKIWNQTHQGPAEQILVPPLQQTNKGITAYGNVSIITAWQNVQQGGGGGGLASNSGRDPYAYYAFSRVIDIDPGDHPNTSSMPSGAGPWTPWSVSPNPPLVDAVSVFGSATSASWTDPPRIVMVNTGAPISSSTTASSAVKHGLAFSAGGVAAGLAYSFISGKAANAVFGNAWSQFMALTKESIGAVEKTLGVRETRRRR